MYLYNSETGHRLDFFLARGKHKMIQDEMKCLSINTNENIVILTKRSPQYYRLIIITMNGKFVKKMTFRPHFDDYKAYDEVISAYQLVIGCYLYDDKSKLAIESFPLKLDNSSGELC